ncbi:MAG: hypothetical protein R2822_28650 [Spirosomataceae bacterium]
MGKEITKINDTTFAIDKQYYIQVTSATIRNIAGRQELLIPASAKINYSLLW